MKRDVNSQKYCFPLQMSPPRYLVPGGSIYYSPVMFTTIYYTPVMLIQMFVCVGITGRKV